MTTHELVRRAGYTLAGVWIFGGALFFYLRFSLLVYTAHREAIAALLEGVFGR